MDVSGLVMGVDVGHVLASLHVNLTLLLFLLQPYTYMHGQRAKCNKSISNIHHNCMCLD